MIKSFAELKRILQPGIALTLVATSMQNHKYLGKTRKIAKTQSNAIQFEGGSWLQHGKADKYKFTEKGFIVDASHKFEEPFTEYLEYAIEP